MDLLEWEIWYTYSTYLIGEIEDLSSVAKEMVESGLAPCVMHRDGETFWRSNDEVRTGITTVKVDPRGSPAKVSLKPHGNPKSNLTGFAYEAWFQSARLRYGEVRLFGEDNPGGPPPYIRAFLGKCILISEKEKGAVDCYPIVKLYQSGVLSVELRIIGISNPIGLDTFIDKYVNLFQIEFSTVGVSPAIAKLASVAYVNYTVKKHSAFRRYSTQKLIKGHDEVISKLTSVMEHGDFSFEVAPLLSSEADAKESTDSFVLTIFSIIGFISSKPHKGWKWVVRGQRPLIQPGGYWEGRPHIHVVRHGGQMDTARKNEGRHKDSFARILSRTTDQERNPKLPPNVRVFDDYSVYITSQAILWVWAKQGIEAQEEWADANRGQLIYEHQTCGEMLEYGYMLHRSLAERIISAPNSEGVLRIRKSLLELRSQMRRSSHYGEVTDLLNRGWEAMGVSNLREDVNESLAIRAEETKRVESARNERLTRILTFVFGLLAVPPIATEVVAPIWELLGIWRPANTAAAKLFMIVVAVMCVLVIIYALSLTVSRDRTKAEG